jgi:hypothetical protein
LSLGFTTSTRPITATSKELDQLDQLMSFESICGILGWDVGLVRQRAKVLKKEDLDRVGPNLMDL